MKKILLFLLVLALSCTSHQLFAQKEVWLTGKLTSCNADSLRLFILDGVSLRQVAVIAVMQQGEDKVFSIKINQIPLGFYFLGLGKPQNTVPLILGSEDQIYVEGACESFSRAMVGNSPIHVKLQEANQKLKAWQAQMGKLIGEFRVNQRAKRDQSATIAKMQKVDQLKIGFLNELKETHPYLAKVIAPQIYVSFQSGGEGFTSEAEYFASKYFQFVDFSDPAYNRIPQFHDAFKSYSSNVAQVGLNTSDVIAHAEKQLSGIPKPSSAHKAALLGLVAGFQSKDEDAFARFTAEYLEYYPNDNPAIAQQLSKSLASMKHRLIGVTAPDIPLPSPDGETISLKDYRGKYLLVDFWASWCGPCRQENPNVRRMYAAYKDKGFEILGVSLDRNRDRWVQAIEKDQLPWKHVSDLKQWGSLAAKTYGVHSIPYTVLLDPNGKIIAKKLRGAALEKELERLLGDKESR
ncbi:MAG: TlpA disulfide reductase family protein [Bacteroidia bacterium]|nr:TlpA disulfide reductase family protein [Bacteroidia bacterium]